MSQFLYGYFFIQVLLYKPYFDNNEHNKKNIIKFGAVNYINKKADT